ncbi:hypothetical protein NQ176_g3156 [Zarea fungicola]|uniref:Uncharacterized protein n=1 Tax=Zarea fungicola TaxID=93591 RepID=A0ACC1NMF4_9HYPO|nr:hypothetical protein NQ176_g3156 [Lecanicillium fungicola]
MRHRSLSESIAEPVRAELLSPLRSQVPRRIHPAAVRLPLLSSCELELLSHYITHASRVIPSDTDDMFALHVGMPNLAFTSGAVMGSMLALSAACKCYDMLKSTGATLEKHDEMRRLLALADQHHQVSLGQLQQDIIEAHFDSVLANAALMVLYAMSCHRVRVLLVRKAKAAGTVIPSDMLPFQSQWITSIRAAHVAFVGLLQPGARPAPEAATPTYPSPSMLSEPGENQHFCEDGPSEETRRLVLPIVTATYETALLKLRSRSEHSAAGGNSHSMADVKMEACMASLGILEQLFLNILNSKQRPSAEPSPLYDFGVLENASPWLIAYLARVTSAAPSRLWRRAVTAFVNQVPAAFLQLVQSALDHMPVEENQSSQHGEDELMPMEPAHKPAMDIFAHWLVLVMLLDSVWWIGDIGHWELGRILRFMKTKDFKVELASGDDAWWPETMYAIQSTLTVLV